MFDLSTQNLYSFKHKCCTSIS